MRKCSITIFLGCTWPLVSASDNAELRARTRMLCDLKSILQPLRDKTQLICCRRQSAVNSANCVLLLLLDRTKKREEKKTSCASDVHCGLRWSRPRISVPAQGHWNNLSRHQNQKNTKKKKKKRSSLCKDLSFSILLAATLPLSLPSSLSLSFSLFSPSPSPLLYQGSETPWEALISSAHPEELMTSNVPVNAEKAEHPS